MALVIGCSSGPSALRPPDVDPEGAADEAMVSYDKDGDGVLSEEELEACPGLVVGLEMYDQDGDRRISREEIAERLTMLVEREVALTELMASVRLEGRPLEGATIRFVPEAYLGDAIKPASGVTGKLGSTRMAINDKDLPENQRGIAGVQYGTYRVEVTHPEIEIPAKFNTSTTLGYESLPGNRNVRFDLESK